MSVTAGGGGGSPAVGPRVTRVKIKGTKKFYVYGENFSANSVIRLNGVNLAPKSFEGDLNSARLYFKGRLGLGPSGTNVVVILNNIGTSQPYNF